MVEVRVLGAVEVRTATVTLSGSDRQLAVLAMLVAERGRVVSADRLIDQLWDGEPPASGAGSLQAYVSRLRRVLEPDRRPRGAATVLVSEGSGYALRLDPDAVDAWAFERDLVGAADRPAEQTLEVLQRHLAGWRGQAYAQTEAPGQVITFANVDGGAGGNATIELRYSNSRFRLDVEVVVNGVVRNLALPDVQNGPTYPDQPTTFD